MKRSRSDSLCWIPIPFLLLVLYTVVQCGELVVHLPKGTFTAGQEILTSVVVLDSSACPGAYTMHISFDTAKVTYSSMVSSKDGPFAVAPSVKKDPGSLTLAGFQGVTKSAAQPYAVLSVISFVSKVDRLDLLSAQAIQVKNQSVYSVSGTAMPLTVAYRTGTVLRPFARTSGKVTLSAQIRHRYLTFTIPSAAPVSVKLCRLDGRIVCEPLKNELLRSGTHSIFLGNAVAPGTYLAILKAGSVSAQHLMGVVR